MLMQNFNRLDAVSLELYAAGDFVLFWISVGCMVLAVAIQCVLVDTTMRRRLLSLFHLKLFFDAIHCFRTAHLSGGYGTAKFTEGVYEATLEGVLQSYKLLRDLVRDNQAPTVLLSLSIVASWNSIALVLNMFLEGEVMDELRAKKWQRYLSLYSFHVVEIGSRTVALACLGVAFEPALLGLAPVGLLLRLALRCAHQSDVSGGMLLASLFLDSVWDSRQAFRSASVLTLVENVAAVAYFASTNQNTNMPVMLVGIALPTLLLVLRICMHLCVMERPWARFGTSSAAFRQQETVVQNPLADKSVPRAVADGNAAAGAGGIVRRVAGMLAHI